MRELVELNRYVHDFASAVWVSGSVVIWLLCREIRLLESLSEAALALGRVARRFAFLTIPALIVTLVTGGIRAATYSRYEHTGEITAAMVWVLVAKHLVFAAFVAWGLWVHRASRKLRS